jgi:hypothetical protein
MTTTTLIVYLFFVAVLIFGIAAQVGYFKVLNTKIFGRKRERMMGPESRGQQTNERFERRSLVEKSRPLLLHGLLYGLIGILAMVVLFFLATRFGVVYLVVGFVVTLSAIIFLHTRSNTRYLVKLVETTPCPQCGKFPLQYTGRSADNRRLLICNQCRTEWDLGPAAL